MIRWIVLSLILILPMQALAFQEFDQTMEPNQKQVAVSILIIDILKIDDAKQLIKMDFVIRMTWHDPGFVEKYKTIQRIDLDKIWSPDVQLANELNLVKKRKEQAEIKPDGTVSYRQRYQGELSLYINYTDFPFDKHEFNIHLVAPLTRKIKFIPDTSLTGQVENFSIQDWIIGEGELVNKPYRILSYEFEACAYQFKVSRRLGFYIWKVMLPLMIVVFMSWTVFWIDPLKIEAQLAVAATAMLTIIAYQITLSNMLPRISYFTRLDYFIVGSNILVFFALLEAVISSAIARDNKEKIAGNLDRYSRYIFPILYLIVLLITFLS